TEGAAVWRRIGDYSEGTWTVAFTCSTSGTITLDGSYETGNYTKVGRQVTVVGNFKVASVDAPVGTLTLTGLPFTCGDTNAMVSAISVRATALAVEAITSIQGYVVNNTTTLRIQKFEAGSSSVLAGDVEANSFFAISATYFTD
ncbi:unnamed protein product, partial [marine sediment metagenome]